MTNLKNWNHYYNLEGTEQVRANLVYTPYVSPDKKTFCMSFNREEGYHIYVHENFKWTDELLSDRFNRELLFYARASKVVPTLDLVDVDTANRRIFLKWHGDDFYMQGLTANGYDNVLPNWQEQWTNLITTMWDANILKCSLHPNSWVAVDGVLTPFNWFFCFDKAETGITIRSLLLQISDSRQDKLIEVLNSAGLDIDKPYASVDLQKVALESFKSNYPEELINNLIKKYNDLLS